MSCILNYIHMAGLTIEIMSRRATAQQRRKMEAGYAIVDVTSKSPDSRFVKFSPFYPVGSLVIPGNESLGTSESVEGAWQGLKIFEREGIDAKKMKVISMKGLKRKGGETRGRVTGHAFNGGVIGYVEARKKIYLPLYSQALVLLDKELRDILQIAKDHQGKLVLLDYETNEVVNDPRKPLSHASLVAKALLSLAADMNIF